MPLVFTECGGLTPPFRRSAFVAAFVKYGATGWITSDRDFHHVAEKFDPHAREILYRSALLTEFEYEHCKQSRDFDFVISRDGAEYERGESITDVFEVRTCIDLAQQTEGEVYLFVGHQICPKYFCQTIVVFPA